MRGPYRHLNRFVKKGLRKVIRTVNKKAADYQFLIDNGGSLEVPTDSKRLEKFLIEKLDLWVFLVDDTIENLQLVQERLLDQAGADPWLKESCDDEHDSVGSEIVKLRRLKAEIKATALYVSDLCSQYYND